ncbi:hypothetical protein [Siccirubricoccus phaeus]|uniref:hypothetical protein n=1 Tax=Siccirubricoccus phaeus TaxID=2595053 RepID=UPI0011F1F804|nr:hypothetical protein [Siccirubricoccus phaeus]
MSDLEAIAARFYPSMAPQPEAPQSAPEAASVAEALAQPAEAPKPSEAQQDAGTGDPFSDAAERMFPFSGIETRGYVDWQEAAAERPADYDLAAPPGTLRDGTPEGQAAEARFRTALMEAGLGRTQAAELWQDALAAQASTAPRRTMEQAEAELRKGWGARYETKLAAARGAITKAAQTSPEIMEFLERTGLGNDPRFIRKVAAMAARRK